MYQSKKTKRELTLTKWLYFPQLRVSTEILRPSEYLKQIQSRFHSVDLLRWGHVVPYLGKDSGKEIKLKPT